MRAEQCAGGLQTLLYETACFTAGVGSLRGSPALFSLFCVAGERPRQWRPADCTPYARCQSDSNAHQPTRNYRRIPQQSIATSQRQHHHLCHLPYQHQWGYTKRRTRRVGQPQFPFLQWHPGVPTQRPGGITTNDPGRLGCVSSHLYRPSTPDACYR